MYIYLKIERKSKDSRPTLSQFKCKYLKVFI